MLVPGRAATWQAAEFLSSCLFKCLSAAAPTVSVGAWT